MNIQKSSTRKRGTEAVAAPAVQRHGTGPRGGTFVDPSDDPRKP